MADESYVIDDAVIKIHHNLILELNDWKKHINEEIIEKMNEVWEEKYMCRELFEITDMVRDTVNDGLDVKSLEKMNKELKDRVVELQKMLAEKSVMEWHAIAAVATICAVVHVTIICVVLILMITSFVTKRNPMFWH